MRSDQENRSNREVKGRKKDDYFKIFYKGVFMGLADIIPGVSGGTIAFITGIYPRLIESIKSLNPRRPSRIDFPFLLPLVSGIALAFLLASRPIDVALTMFPAPTYAFFFGIIAMSTVVIWKREGKPSLSFVLMGALGFLVAFQIAGFGVLQYSHQWWALVLSGFVAISAMLLPGISGAFILLLLGQYRFLLRALEEFTVRWPTLLIFLAGAVCGLIVFSRVLSWLLSYKRVLTYAFLTGLMIGALRLLVQEIASTRLSSISLSISFLTALGGMLLIWLLELR